MLQVVGWGVTVEGDTKSVSKELRESILPVVNRATCRTGVPGSFKRYTQVGDKFCAGTLDKGTQKKIVVFKLLDLVFGTRIQ